MSYNVKTLQPGDFIAQKIQVNAFGPMAYISVNDDALLCDDPDQLDALSDVLAAAARDLRASLVEHGQVRDNRSVA